MDTVKELQARFERLPVWPFSYWLYPVIGSSFFFAFYDMVNIGFVLPDVIKQFHTTQAWADWSITSGLIGYIVGSFLDARISDRFGRRIGLLVSVIAFSIGSFLAASSTDIILLIIWRFVMGLGLGAEIACGVSYASEMAPSQLRGKSVAIAVAFGYLGFVVTPYIAMGILAIAPWAWRLMFVIGGIGGILFLLIRIGMPKSPHWLFFHGRLDEAKQLIQKAEARVQARIKKALPDVHMSHTSVSEIKETQAIYDLLRSSYFKYICAFVLVWFFYYIGNYGLLTLGDTLLLRVGYNQTVSVMIVSIQSIGFIVGSIIAIFVIDRLERKWLCIITALIWALALLVIGIFNHYYVIVILGFLATLTISLLVPIMYTYTAETFPTAYRATGTSICDGLGHLGGAFCGQIIFLFYHLFHTHYASNLAALATMAVSGVLTAFFLLFGKRLNGKHLTASI